MHDTHLSWINDKSNASKRAAYTSARSAAQRGLRQMKKQWWLNEAVELQHLLWREHGISLKTKVEVYPHNPLVRLRVLDPVQEAHQAARTIPHALSSQNCWDQMAGPCIKYSCAGDVWHFGY